MRTMLRHLFLPLLFLAAQTAVAVKPHMLKAANQDACERWVDSVYNTLSPRDRIAQLVIANVIPASGNGTKQNLALLIEKNHVGGLLFSKGSLSQFAEMTNYAQSISKVPLLMTLDGEWGPSMRIAELNRFPNNMALGAVADPQLLYDYGCEVARQCRLIGHQVNFAPVVDVNTTPLNPVIGYRSFGEDPARVSELAIAYSKGLEDGGVMAVAKHFPGHGDTSADSHHALPKIDKSLSQLEQAELVPFRRYVQAGFSGVMVGHLSVPALDKSGAPASLSHAITTGLLCDKLGFEGMIFTDALAMDGANSNTNRSVAALQAGADALLGASNPIADIRAIEKAIKAHKLSQEAIDARCRKILTYKYLLGLNHPQVVNINGLANAIESPQAEALRQKLANACITVVRNDGRVLPLRNLGATSIAIVNLGTPPNHQFATMCSHYADVDIYNGLEHLSAIKKHDVIIAAIYNNNASTQSALSRIVAPGQTVVPVFFVNPYRTAKFVPSLDHCRAIVMAYDDTAELCASAAQAIFGGINVTGSLPVTIDGLAKAGVGVKIPKNRLGYSTPVAVGMRPWITDSIDAIVNTGLRTGAFPGCQVLVAKDGQVVVDKVYGYVDTKKSAKVTPQVIYDLASVSKATSTLPGIMAAYDDRLFQLDQPVSEIITPLKDTPKSKITVSQLLYHESGMPASLNVFDMMMDTASYTGKLFTAKPTKDNTIKFANRSYGNAEARLRSDLMSTTRTDQFPIAAASRFYVGQSTLDTLMNRIYNIPLRNNNKYNYSCLNFALLMDMEQRLTGRPHDEFVGERIFRPLGMTHTGYRPLSFSKVRYIAPTEHDKFLRRQTVRGYVHDELAAMSGGVQGNAGLFSNTADLAKLCQMWLNGGEYGGERVLSEATVKRFTTSKSSTCRRGLGFDKPDVDNPDSSPTTELADPSVFGHLGFTGTCFWVDPKHELIFIFLTNRVNPSRDNDAFNALNPRPRILEQVYRSL